MAAPIPLDDRGLLLGDGLFETLLWRSGGLVLADDHAERMASGAALLGLPGPGADAFTACAVEAVRAAGLAEARAAVRVTLTAGSGGRGLDRPPALQTRLFATAAPAIRPGTCASLIVAETRRNERSPLGRVKSLSYLDNVLARREALQAGADEAVMLNTRDEVASAAAANIFWIKDGVLFTPAEATGRLDGIMARQVRVAAAALAIEIWDVRQDAAAMRDADALFLTNSLIGIRPAHLQGAALATPHPLVARLTDAIAPYA